MVVVVVTVVVVVVVGSFVAGVVVVDQRCGVTSAAELLSDTRVVVYGG